MDFYQRCDTMDEEHIYTRETFFNSLCEVIKHGWIKKHKLIVDITLRPEVLEGAPLYLRSEKWTDAHDDEICSKGYRRAKGLHDSILWSGVRIYVRIHNAIEFPISEVFPEKKDTAFTLNDAMLSDTDNKFKKSLAKAALTQAADWQRIILFGGLGVAAVILTKYFGLW